MDSYWDALGWFQGYVNGIRRWENKSEIKLLTIKCEEAQKHNEYMSRINDLQHSNQPVMENIAYLGYKPDILVAVKEMFRIWIEDGEHRDILLCPNKHWFGLALWYTNDGVYGTFRIF